MESGYSLADIAAATGNNNRNGAACGATGFGLSFSSFSPGEAGAMASAETVQMAQDSRVLQPEQISMRALL